MKFPVPSLDEIVADYYRNSPSWPLERPTDLDQEAKDFLKDGGKWHFDDVRLAIEKFWNKVAV